MDVVLKAKNTEEFRVDMLMNTIIKLTSKSKLVELYTLWGSSTSFTLKSTADILDGNMELAMKILKIGKEYRVLICDDDGTWH